MSRHYGLPIGKPSTWVANPVVTLRVRSLSPGLLDYSDYLNFLQDRRPFSSPASHPKIALKGDAYCFYKQWKADITEDSGIFTTRVLVSSIEIWLTPLLPSVVIHLLEDNLRAVR